MNARDYAAELAESGEIRRYPLDKPCAHCGNQTARITAKDAHLRMDCETCGRYVKFIGKAALGVPTRSVRSRPDISPSQRTRILDACGERCIYCGRGAEQKAILHVGHFLSVEEGRALGATDDELQDDENLAAECEECNLGRSDVSTRPRTWARHILLLIRAKRTRGCANG